MNRFAFIDNIKVFGNFIRCMIHAAVPYMVTYSAMWPFDEEGSYVFDFAIFEGHLFLMELFFVLTGYMFALQISKKTTKEFLINRLKKILIPFLLCLVIIMPVVLTYFNLKSYTTYEWLEIDGLIIAYKEGWNLGLSNFFPTGHLWFLYYLMIFYIISLLLRRFITRIISYLERFSFFFLFIASCLISIVAFFFMKRWLVDNPLTLIPELPSLIHYYIFFFFGIISFSSKKLTAALQLNKYKFLVAGIIIGIFAIVPQLFFEKSEHQYYTLIKFTAIILHVIATYSLTISIWALFTQEKSRNYSKPIAYLSDANYWIYITFLPIAMLIQLCLLPLSFSIFLKFLITYILGITICLVIYEYFVRYTWIGTMLNRKKTRKKATILTSKTL